jgi:hypothetical protein
MKRTIMIAAGLLPVFWTSAALAQPPAPPAPVAQAPIPASKSPEDVAAWRTANVKVNGWIPLGGTDRWLTYLPDGIKASPDGVIQVGLRNELFQPETANGVLTRSMIQRWEIDCMGGRLRITGETRYPELNLQGKLVSVAASTDWTPISASAGLASLQASVCKAAK